MGEYENMIQVIGQFGCVYCELLCNDLDLYAIPYKYRELNPRLRRWFRRRGYTTVPQVWLDGVHIGGHKEFQHWLKERENE